MDIYCEEHSVISKEELVFVFWIICSGKLKKTEELVKVLQRKFKTRKLKSC